MAARRATCAAARVFVSPRGGRGGNPVIVFLDPGAAGPTTPDERVGLAQTCPFESVVVENVGESPDLPPPTFHFFLPTGEEVSFRTHAAIGACSFLVNQNNLQSASMSVATVPFLASADGSRYNAKVKGNEVELQMEVQHEETECDALPLQEVLSELGLGRSDLPKYEDGGVEWPTYLNSSVASPKTLIPLRTVEILHAVTHARSSVRWKSVCDSIGSTGIYLYSALTGSNAKDVAAEGGPPPSFECRHFPRVSGYPEDPATGIAAGALAASLHERRIFGRGEDGNGTYDVFQGMAMERPSKIRVKIGGCGSKGSPPMLKISYTGLVEYDMMS